ncbi:hypothetical protein [Homoserinimonas hongtaonis]|uniref:hypothetical protein n=1 Tax=Homoserinimonas hongtaonis TaxID=2079791 RepID=UPI0018EFCF52|nr:hypothetical protein [Salinibacterium hongtaonis]
MQWWNDTIDWITSTDGREVITTAVLPFVAIIVAGLIAALIGRSTSRRTIALIDREHRTTAVTAIISAARRAAKWNTLSLPEQQHAEHLFHEADTSIRLLPLAGSAMAADWAAHEIDEMKKNSVSFSFQADQSLIDFRDRLVEWQGRPSRAKKLFKSDLETWAYESSLADKDLVAKQQEWAKNQVEDALPATFATPVAPATAPAATLTAPATTPTTAPADEPASAPSPWPSRDSAAWPASSTAEATTADVPEPSQNTSAAETAPEIPKFVVPSVRPLSVDEGNTPTSDDATAAPVSAGTVRQRISPDTTY